MIADGTDDESNFEWQASLRYRMDIHTVLRAKTEAVDVEILPFQVGRKGSRVRKTTLAKPRVEATIGLFYTYLVIIKSSSLLKNFFFYHSLLMKGVIYFKDLVCSPVFLSVYLILSFVKYSLAAQGIHINQFYKTSLI